MDTASLLSLLMACAPQIDARTASALVAVESDHHPHAIGIVNGALVRQPRTRGEAVATATALQAAGWNFSLGLAQINVRNLARLGLTLDSVFEPCTNLAAMQTVLSECFERSARKTSVQPKPDFQHALRQALSCYYSGNPITGFEHGYVRRVAQAAARATPSSPLPQEDR